MNYCLNYFQQKKSKYINDFNEITIEFKPADKTLIDFMLLHLQQRINIYITDNKDFIDNNRIKLFEAIKEEHPEIIFVFKLQDWRKDETKAVYEVIRNSEKDFKYFFNNLALNFDMFWGIIALQPSDIYIAEELGFYAKQCGDAAHERNIQIRAYPNVAQSSWEKRSGITSFFIRPEDIKYYEPYIDVCEFYGESNKVDTYFKIYNKDQEWFGDLSELIIGLTEHIDSRCLLPNFGERRLKCGKRCLKGQHCKTCAATQYLAEKLSKNNVTLKQLEKKKKKSKE